MNDVSQKQKNNVLKSLAIVGFLGIIIFIAWLSIQLISVIPNTFSSLASLAEGIDQYQQSVIETERNQEELTVTSDRTIVNAGGSVALTWETSSIPGTYTFTYSCTEGVAVDILTDEGERSIACGHNYNLGDTSSVNLRIDSEKDRFTDLKYTVAFLATNDTTPRASGSELITVHNSDIADILIASTQTESEETEPVQETPEETVAETPTTQTNPETIEEPATVGPTYEQEFTYEIPVSNPNGKIDLTSRFIQSGTIVGNTFFAGTIKIGEAGAVQFEVRNLGNKTSEEWTYEVLLPGDITYTSPAQTPLKPNETATITVGFPEALDSVHTFTLDVNTTRDKNTSNNDTTYSVAFVK